MGAGRGLCSTEVVPTIDVDVLAALFGRTRVDSADGMVMAETVAVGDTETTVDTGKLLCSARSL